MFCILYELFQSTNLKLHEFEDCSKECEHFSEDCCNILDITNIKLTDQKYSWIIDKKINFSIQISNKNKSIFYDKIIRIIHPMFSDIWIFKALKEDKETVFYFSYIGNSKTNFNSIEELNQALKEKCQYDGRNIVEEDFIKGDK